MMIRTTSLRIAISLVGFGALTIPPLALASSSPSGGASIFSSASPTLPATVQPAPTTTVSGDGITVTARTMGLRGHPVFFSGRISPAAAGRKVELAEQTGSRWTYVAGAVTAANGSFTATLYPASLGQLTIRTVIVNTLRYTPAVTITVYRPAVATWYGPGLFGHRTACGRTLTRSTLGVANRRLPCGTQISIYYRGRTIVVPVIDRGPYANDANWDLTEATAAALGITETSTIGATPVSG
jgi:hypothetical protein